MFRTFVCAVVAAFGLIQSAAHAHPETPFEVSLGENPRRTFGGVLSDPDAPTLEVVHHLLTVPAGQEFIVTTIRSKYPGEIFLQYGPDEGDAEFGYPFFKKADGPGFATGNARHRVPEGTALYLRNHHEYKTAYVLEGYFVAAGSPYRSVYSGKGGVGAVPTGTLTTVFTASEGRDFVVTMALLDSDYCDIFVDSELKVPALTGAASRPNEHNISGSFWSGRGQLLVPAGSSLQLNGCQYYIEGHYVGS